MSQLISQSLCINISSLDESVTQLCDFESRGPLSVSGRSLQLETIHAEAVTAVQVSMITKHLAGGYLGVSRKFLMPQVRQLDSLLVAENPTLADLEISQAIKEASDGIHVEMENSKRDCAKEVM